MNIIHVRRPEESTLLMEKVQSIYVNLLNAIFIGDDPISEIEFVTRFIEEADSLHLTEAYVFLIKQSY